MIEVTADTNIVISGFVFRGIPRQFIAAAEDGYIQLALSDAIEGEISRILAEKFGWSAEQIAEPLALLAGCTVRVHPTRTINAVADEPDNRVLECAVTAGSRYIVSGDHGLLRLAVFEGIRIVRVADFMQLINA